MRRRLGSATIPYFKHRHASHRRAVLAAIAIAVLAILPRGSAWAEWEAAAPAPAGTPTAPVQGIFGSAPLESRGLGMVSQWNRVLDRLPAFTAALSACAADPARCTAPWMRAWLQARRAAAGLDRHGQLQAVNRFFNRWPYKTDRETYRASEYWAAPDEFMANSGDCEDYAIAKFFALRELGFANRELRIVVVYDNLRRIGHAVLAVYTEGDILILNNQTDTIASHARYDNFVPWYLVNETTLWTATGPTLSALIPELSEDGASAKAGVNLGALTRRPGARQDAPRSARAKDRNGPV